MSIVVSVIAAIVITLGLVVWYGRKKAYLARKGEGLMKSAGDLAREAADKISDSAQNAARKVANRGGLK